MSFLNLDRATSTPDHHHHPEKKKNQLRTLAAESRITFAVTS